MKKIIYLLLIAIMPLAFASCDSDPYYDDWNNPSWDNNGNNGNNSGEEDDENTTVEKQLVGTFQCGSGSNYMVLKLKSDLSGSFAEYQDGVVTDEYYFSWNVYGSYLYYTPVNSTETVKMSITIQSTTEVKFGSYLYTRITDSGSTTTLNTYEQQLLGNWKNTDTENGSNVLRLSSDRTGSWQYTDGTVLPFTWTATSQVLYVVPTNGEKSFNMQYTLVNGKLTVDNVPMVKYTTTSKSSTRSASVTVCTVTSFAESATAFKLATHLPIGASFSTMR